MGRGSEGRSFPKANGLDEPRTKAGQELFLDMPKQRRWALYKTLQSQLVRDLEVG